VPVQTDYSDLYPIMAFFLGDEHGQGGHDALAKEIATAGKKWAETHWCVSSPSRPKSLAVTR